MTGHIMPTYGRLAITLDRGEGVWLWDNRGNRYLDALSGIAVCNLGHAHPSVHKALCEQSAILVHTSNVYRIDLQEKLADRLIAKTGMENAFFCNSGAEANEALIKLARRYGHQKGIDKPAIVVMEKSFHGRTLATLSATGNAKIQQGFAPLVEGFVRVPYNDMAAIESALKHHNNIVAVLVEPIQGEGGVNIPASDYLNKIRELCDQHELLMLLDEIQTGIGRTGKFVAYQHNDILPDACSLAKALGNGVPIGACLARGKAAQVLTPGTHGSTFGGNPLACSAALAVLNELDDGTLIEQAETKGRLIASGLQERLTGNHDIADIRHKGLMIGIELTAPCAELVNNALSKGLLINVTNEKTVRLLPPLIIETQQIESLVDILATVIQEFTEKLQHNES